MAPRSCRICWRARHRPYARKNAGYAYCQIGENLASASDSRGFSADGYAKLAVEGWEHSPGHRKNMLLPYVTETGVAVMRAGPNDPRYIAVQLFARPRAMNISFKIHNTSANAVPYTLAGQQHSADAHGTLTLTACMPREISFSTDVRTGAKGHYETRNGQVYTLKPVDGGGVIVELDGARREVSSRASGCRCRHTLGDEVAEAQPRLRQRIAARAEHAGLEKMPRQLQPGDHVFRRARPLAPLRQEGG